MTHIAVVGSRRFPSREIVESMCSKFFQPGDVLVSGGAKGPDTWGEEWAKKNGFETLIFPAKWQEQCHPNCRPITKNGWSYYFHAGFVRNQYVVDASQIILAFIMPDRTGGTMDTIHKGKIANRNIHVFLPDGTETTT